MWLLTLLATTPDAVAAGFQAKTMRAPMSAVEVERPLVLGKASFGYDHKFADGAWSPEGEAVQWESARWLFTTQRLGIRYGFTQSTEFYWDIPFHYARLVNDELGTDTDGFGIGEPKFGWKWELFNRSVPTTSVVLDLQYKMPTGQETAGTYVGGPNTFNTIPMSTGQADLAVFLRGKQQFGPIAVAASVGWVNRFSGVSQFVVEVDQYQFSGRFKPSSRRWCSLARWPCTATSSTASGSKRQWAPPQRASSSTRTSTPSRAPTGSRWMPAAVWSSTSPAGSTFSLPRACRSAERTSSSFPSRASPPPAVRP
jgi:hypothetical protein